MVRKFAVAAVASPARERSRTPAQTVPLASAIVEQEAVPRRATADGPVILTIYKVTDVAADLWSDLENREAALWQIQLKHEARPFSVTYKIKDTFSQYIKEAHKLDASMPADIEQLEKLGRVC